MKRIYAALLSSALATILTACCNSSENISRTSANGEIEFNKQTADLGNLTSGDKAGARFEFRNVSNVDVYITNVSTGCGCTEARFPKDAIRPGRKGSVELIFDSTGMHGYQYKTAIVETNSDIQPVIKLALTASVDY